MQKKYESVLESWEYSYQKLLNGNNWPTQGYCKIVDIKAHGRFSNI